MWKLCRYIASSSPINVINGITFPNTNDSRWMHKEYISITKQKLYGLFLGNIQLVYEQFPNEDVNGRKEKFHSEIFINNIPLTLRGNYRKINRYIEIVLLDYQKRISLQSIQDTKFPELE